jgi:hypothetical protein
MIWQNSIYVIFYFLFWSNIYNMLSLGVNVKQVYYKSKLMFGITVDIFESRWLPVILQKLYSIASVKSRWITVILTYLPWYQTRSKLLENFFFNMQILFWLTTSSQMYASRKRIHGIISLANSRFFGNAKFFLYLGMLLLQIEASVTLQ